MGPLASRMAAAVLGAIVLLGGGAAVAVALTPVDRSEVVDTVAPIVVQPSPGVESPAPPAPAPEPAPVSPQPPVDVDDDDDDDDDDVVDGDDDD